MPITGPETLLYEKKGRIVTITINRPERMNAFNYELMERLNLAWRKFDDDPDAWVAVFTGAGNKAFCAGWDLVDERQSAQAKKKVDIKWNINFTPTDLQIMKPVIAAINGYALAGGFMLAQHCDVRIAAEHAEFGIAEARWNLPAPWVCDLTKQLHLGHALEIVLWADRRMAAKRGYEIGWLNKVVAKDSLMEEANEWADRICYLGPRCIRNLKEIIYRGMYMNRPEALAFALALEQNLKDMKDTVEGLNAFAENRKPKYENEVI